MTYDIKELFVNIPINEVTEIIQNKLTGSFNEQIATHIINLTKAVLSQNYFLFQDTIYLIKE
jgi:hypothetical protein